MIFAGQLHLRATRRADGRTILREQSFQAPFHVSKPYWDEDAGTLLVQVVNPTAGVLAGDQLEARVAVAENATMVVTTPSATRVFTMRDGLASCRQHFTVSAGGWLEVAPEPLVPHAGSRYVQTTEIDVAPGGGVFYVDQLLPGRIGHGEAWAWSELILSTRVRINGELVLWERLGQPARQLAELAAFAGSGDHACFANAVLVMPAEREDGGWRRAIRELHTQGVWAGVTAMRAGGSTIKIVACDPIRLRATLRAVREILARHFPPLGCDLRRY